MYRGRGSRSAGYTIVETLIFLAVSGAMFLTAMLLINGRQARAEFTNSVRDFDSQMQDVANDVSDGYYDSNTRSGQQLTCDINPGNGKVQLHENSGIADTQGTNDECIFIGKAVQLSPDTQRDGYNLITIVGKRLNGTQDVEDFDDSSATAAAPVSGGGGEPDTTRRVSIGGGVRIACAMYFTATPPSPDAFRCTSAGVKIDTMSLITTFKGGTLKGGALQTDLVVSTIGTSSLGRTLAQSASEINGYTTNGTYRINPIGGVMICMQSLGTNQHAVFEIGGEAGRFSTVTTVISGGCG